MMDLTNIFNRYQLAITSIHRNINNTIKQHVRDDITTDQFSIMQYIHHNESSTSTEIARNFGVGKSAITALTNRLHDKQLISRKRDPKDRRIIYLQTTSNGEEVIQQTEKQLYKYLGEKLTYFDKKEIEHFIRALEKLALLMND